MVRQARVEDCDEIIPILKKNKLLQADQGDHYISNLLEASNENFKSIVAEVDGDVVGFMCIDRTTDQEMLRENYSLSSFDDLVKDPKHDSDSKFEATQEQLQKQNTFHVTLFCISPQYAALSDQCLIHAFNSWPDLEFCALTVKDTAPESPIMRYCSFIPSLSSNNPHLLYLANRYNFDNEIEIMRATELQESGIHHLTKSMGNILDFSECVKASLIESEGMEFLTYVASIDSQIVGVFVMELCTAEKNRMLLDQFDIESFCDAKWTNLESTYCIARYLIMNPLFEAQTRYASHFLQRFCCSEVMRQLSLNCILFTRNLSLNDRASQKLVIREFFPVKPRRQIEFPNNIRDGISLPEVLKGNLQIITMPMILSPRLIINTPIVVIGGSDTAVSFLSSLIYVKPTSSQ